MARPQRAASVSAGPGNPGSGVVIRSGACLPGASTPVFPEGLPGGQHARRAGDRDCGRGGRDHAADGSGPSSGARALRLHLVTLPPGTRGRPHRHDQQTAVYLVSGAAELWHGPGFARRSVVQAGDYLYVPPGTPVLAANRGDVSAIAVVASNEPGGADVPLAVPGELASLLSFPVGTT